MNFNIQIEKLNVNVIPTLDPTLAFTGVSKKDSNHQEGSVHAKVK